MPDPMDILSRLRVMQVRVGELRHESSVLAERRREAYRDAATKIISTQNVINSVSARLRARGDCSVWQRWTLLAVGANDWPRLFFGCPRTHLTFFVSIRLTVSLLMRALVSFFTRLGGKHLTVRMWSYQATAVPTNFAC